MRLCSYDRVAVPRDAYVLTDEEGEIYFCSARCLCIWAVQLATRVELTTEQRMVQSRITTDEGGTQGFESLSELAQWATTNALEKLDA